jgi:hypothetical protein
MTLLSPPCLNLFRTQKKKEDTRLVQVNGMSLLLSEDILAVRRFSG